MPMAIIYELVEDLVCLAKGITPEPSPKLNFALKKDVSLYSRLANYVVDCNLLPFGNGDQRKRSTGPLEYALRSQKVSFEVIQYLVEKSVNCTDAELSECRNTLCDEKPSKKWYYLLRLSAYCGANVFQYMLNFPHIKTEHIREIYSDSIPISARIILEKKNYISADSYFSPSFLNSAIFHGNLKLIQYYCQMSPTIIPWFGGEDADISILFSLDNVLDVRKNTAPILDILKYLLMRFKRRYLKELDYILYLLKKLLLKASAHSSGLPIVHYLLTCFKYDKHTLKSAFEKATPNIKTYLSHYDSKTGFDSSQFSSLRELERTELEKNFKFNMNTWKDLSSYAQLNRLVHLALIAQEEKIIDTEDCYPTLSAINRLLPLNAFAVEYAWWRFKSEASKNYEDQLRSLSKYYIHYLKSTGHIFDPFFHSNFNQTINTEGHLSSATTSALEAIELQNNLYLILPDDAIKLIFNYITVYSQLITPGLVHMVKALGSQKKCEECGFLLSQQKVSIFGGKITKISLENSSFVNCSIF